MLRYVEFSMLALAVVVAVYMILGATQWALQARLFPWVIGAALLAITLAEIALRTRAVLSKAGSTGPSTTSPVLELADPRAIRETMRLVVWVGVFLLCIVLFSFPFGLPLATFLYLKVESRESWLLSLVLGGATLAYLYGIFDYGLHLPWPEGIITGLLFPK